MRKTSKLSINNLWTNYIYGALAFTIFFSIADSVTNKFYRRIWHKKTNEERMKLIGLLFFHNIVFFTIYFTSFYLIWGFMSGLYKKKRGDALKLGAAAGIYMLYMFGTLYHWKTNNDKCELTEMQNRLLEIGEENGFRDWISILINNYPKSSKGEGGEGGFRSKMYHMAIIFNIATAGLIVLSMGARLL